MCFINRRQENAYFSLNEKKLLCVGSNDQTGKPLWGSGMIAVIIKIHILLYKTNNSQKERDNRLSQYKPHEFWAFGWIGSPAVFSGRVVHLVLS